MAQLPKQLGGVPLQHALEVRNAEAHGPALVTAARAHGVAVVIEDSDEAPRTAMSAPASSTHGSSAARPA